jgi:hypothetical protein
MRGQAGRRFGALSADKLLARWLVREVSSAHSGERWQLMLLISHSQRELDAAAPSSL